jgi:prevent-host-death family protein
VTLTTLTATEARKQLYSLLDNVTDSHVPIHITGKRHSAVLVSADDWRAIEEALFLESMPGMKDSIIRGMRTPAGKCAKEPGW